MRSLISSVGYCQSSQQLKSWQNMNSNAIGNDNDFIFESELLAKELNYFEKMESIRSDNLGNVTYSNQILTREEDNHDDENKTDEKEKQYSIKFRNR